jgi:hypothetical protein
MRRAANADSTQKPITDAIKAAGGSFTCATCHLVVPTKPSVVGKKTYCSRACQVIGYRECMKGSSNPNYRAAFERLHCEHCQHPIASFHKTRRFCSWRCFVNSGTARRNAMRNGRLSGSGGNLDRNHHAIVEVLRKYGASVYSLAHVGGGCPDILVGFRRQDFLLEIKNPESRYGKKGFNELQQEFASTWRGSKVLIVRTPLEALQAIGAIRRTA